MVSLAFGCSSPEQAEAVLGIGLKRQTQLWLDSRDVVGVGGRGQGAPFRRIAGVEIEIYWESSD